MSAEACALNGNTKNCVSRDDVKEFYGKRLTTNDLKVPKHCPLKPTSMPKHVRQALGQVHEDITKRYFGCGLVIPESLESTSVLDLGSGAGQDCFVLSKLVGESGHVTGIDMTDELLDVARKYIPYHMTIFGYSKPNLNFVKGYIEKLGDAGLKDNSFDIIVSNCVICLSQDKKSVLEEAYRVLKDGGELYFSDMYADHDLPTEVRNDKKLWGEGFAAALWWQDLVTLAEQSGFTRPRLVTAAKLQSDTDDVAKKLGEVNHAAVTYRLFKVSEKYGPCKVTYNGCIKGHEQAFSLDYNHVFKTGEPVLVDGDVATILKNTRCREKFTFEEVDLDSKYTFPEHDLNPFNLIKNSSCK